MHQKRATGIIIIIIVIFICSNIQFLQKYFYFRYDGIYKVVKYYPDTGKSGFRVWRYLLRRDDLAAAPWTEEGKARIEALGLKPMYPDGYLEAMAKNKINKTRTNKKRNILMEEENSTSSKKEPPKKKRKLESYELESEIVKHIEKDQANTKLWDECRKALSDGKAAFLQQVSERYVTHQIFSKYICYIFKFL